MTRKDRAHALASNTLNPMQCDYCGEPLEEEEGQTAYAGDESMTMCEACADHML